MVWGELGGVEEVSFSSCGGWMKCIVVSFWFCFCAFCGCADGGLFCLLSFWVCKGNLNCFWNLDKCFCLQILDGWATEREKKEVGERKWGE